MRTNRPSPSHAPRGDHPSYRAVRNARPRLVAPAAALLAAASGLLLVSGCAGNRGRGDAPTQSALDAYVQGVKAYHKGDTGAAMANLQQAIQRNNDLIMARSMLGDLYRARAEYEAAKEQYQAVTALDPYHYFNHYRLGLAYQLLQQFKEAAASYLKALDLKPDDAKSNMSLGTVYLSLDKPQEALPYARKAVQYDPQNAAAWVNLGLILDENGNFTESEAAYRKALDLDSSLTLVRMYLGESLMRQGRFADARSVFQDLVRVEDTPLHRKLLGDALAKEQKFDAAVEQYRAALKLDPNYYPALNEIGETRIAEYKKGLTLDESRREAALEAWKQSLAIKRDQPHITARTMEYAKPVNIPR